MKTNRFRGWMLATVAALMMTLPGCSCIKPFEEPVFVDAGNSDTVFVVPMTGDTSKQTGFKSEEFLKKNMVATKRVRVPREWIQQGRKWIFGISPYTGYYIPNARIITVSRAPVTVNWSKEKGGAIWVESSDSVGFSTGIGLTARIAAQDFTDGAGVEHKLSADEAAARFLYNYPSVSKKEGGVVESEVAYHVTADLAIILDKEVKERVQMVFADFAAGFEMDDLRAKKRDIMSAIKDDIVPFFAERGITITTVSNFGGFEYENPKIQEAIDAVFQAQQDKEVAIAEFEAADERKKALKSLGEGKAAQEVEIAKGEAAAIELKADAKAYEAQKLKEQEEFYLRLKELEVQNKWLDTWDGKLPVYMFSSGGKGSNLLLQVPSPKSITPSK